MKVTVRLFAGVRERVGSDTVVLDLPDGALVADALGRLEQLAPDLPLVLAVNREYASPDLVLVAGDELAVVPPVSGGSGDRHAVIRSEPLSLDALSAAVADPRAGAVVTFSGTTRDVDFLDYEAYVEMAQPLIEAIVREAIRRHGLCAAAAEHRVGRVPRGEASVIVAASAPHRPEAFMGARELIDRIKAEVPIWKQEEGAWVPGTVPGAVAAPTAVLDVSLDGRVDHDTRAVLVLDGHEVRARVSWLGGRFHQLRCEPPLLARRGDPITLRDGESGDVLAEGRVLDPLAKRHGPTNDALVRLARLERGEDVAHDGAGDILPPPLDAEARALERRYLEAGTSPPADAELDADERAALFALREAGVVVKLERGRHIHVDCAPD